MLYLLSFSYDFNCLKTNRSNSLVTGLTLTRRLTKGLDLDLKLDDLSNNNKQDESRVIEPVSSLQILREKLPADSSSAFTLDAPLWSLWRHVKVIVLGGKAVGKTSLIQQFIQKTYFRDEYTPTTARHVYRCNLMRPGRFYDLQLTDCPTIPEFPQDSLVEWELYRNYGLRHCNAYILVYDLGDLDSFNYVLTMREQILDSRHQRDADSGPAFAILIVGNKKDIVLREEQLARDYQQQQLRRKTIHKLEQLSQQQQRELVVLQQSQAQPSADTVSASNLLYCSRRRKIREIGTLIRKQWKCAYVECSAKYYLNVEQVFRELLDVIPQDETAIVLPTDGLPMDFKDGMRTTTSSHRSTQCAIT